VTKNICFINNYNNEKYILDCLESVYAQTKPFDEVILVDDGSTDSSLEIITQFSLAFKNLRLLKKENEGQISTFNFVLPFIPENSQIFLLDGDDIYPTDYLFNVLKLISSETWDFAFCEQQKFINGAVRSMNTSVINNQPPYYFSKTSALTRSRGCWIGSPTSCISLSDKVFRRIFPYPYYRDKIFWVDDLMIFSSSILGVRKVHLPSLGVGWRSHPNNVTKKHHSANDIETRKKSINNIFEWYCGEFDIPRYPGIIEFFIEFKQLGVYWRSRLDLPNKYRMLNRLIRNSIQQTMYGGSKRN
jgi:glycosyltransferase involved in cell wall biosynthesis